MITDSALEVGPTFLVIESDTVEIPVAVKWSSDAMASKARVRAWVDEDVAGSKSEALDVTRSESSTKISIVPFAKKSRLFSRRITIECTGEISQAGKIERFELKKRTVVVVHRYGAWAPLVFGLIAAAVVVSRLYWMAQHHVWAHDIAKYVGAASAVWTQLTLLIALSPLLPKLAPIQPKPRVLWPAAGALFAIGLAAPLTMRVYENRTGEIIRVNGYDVDPKGSVVIGPGGDATFSFKNRKGKVCTGDDCDLREQGRDQAFWPTPSTPVGCAKVAWPIAPYVIGGSKDAAPLPMELNRDSCTVMGESKDVDLKLLGLSDSHEVLSVSWEASQTDDKSVRDAIGASLMDRPVKLEVSNSLNPSDRQKWSVVHRDSANGVRTLWLKEPVSGAIRVMTESALEMETGTLQNVDQCQAVHVDVAGVLGMVQRPNAKWIWSPSLAGHVVVWCDDIHDDDELIVQCRRTTEDVKLPSAWAHAKLKWSNDAVGVECGPAQHLTCDVEHQTWSCVSTAPPPLPLDRLCYVSSVDQRLEFYEGCAGVVDGTRTRGFATDLARHGCILREVKWCN